ncbi:unnamed protein product, partial [Rotaria socialis]
FLFIFISAACSPTTCANAGLCLATTDGAGWRCVCQPQFTGDRCQNSISVSQCAAQPCANGGTCVDGPFTFNCKCPYPFKGQRCELISTVQLPCDSNPCLNSATCTNGGTNFLCSCPPGYTGSLCETNIRPAFCSIDCSPGYCFSNSGIQPPYACYCTDDTIQLNRCASLFKNKKE